MARGGAVAGVAGVFGEAFPAGLIRHPNRSPGNTLHVTAAKVGNGGFVYG